MAAEALNLQRQLNGRLTALQVKKIKTALGKVGVIQGDRKTIMQWIPGQAVVVNPSPVYSALVAVNAVKTIY